MCIRDSSNLAFSTRARHVVYPGRETFLLLSPTYFDSSVAGIWGTLTAGATLVVASDDQRRDPSEIARLVESHEVGRTLMIPSLYRELLAAAPVGTRLRSLREVIVAGERLPDELVRAHFESLPDTDLVNEYGPVSYTHLDVYKRQALVEGTPASSAEVVQWLPECPGSGGAPVDQVKAWWSLQDRGGSSDDHGVLDTELGQRRVLQQVAHETDAWLAQPQIGE